MPEEDKTIEGVSFSDLTVDYDGNEHEILVVGELPEGVSVEYTSNKGTNAGVYSATAVLSGEGYKTKALNATLTINKIDFDCITFDGLTVDYNGEEHTVEYVGELPEGATVTYTGGEDGENSATNAGNYTIKLTIEKENYNTYEKTVNLVIKKLNFTGINFDGFIVDYNGEEHSVEYVGVLPEGAVVTYTGGENGGNSATNSGTYLIKLTIEKKNYNTYEKTVNLVINKLNFTDLSFKNMTVDYDNQLHSLTVTGSIPLGSTIVYSGGEDGLNSAITPGEYTIYVAVSNRNYHTYTASAVLNIRTTEALLYVKCIGDKIYFQNALDKDYLYVLENGEIKRIDKSTVNGMLDVNGKLFVANSALSSSISSITDEGRLVAHVDANASYVTTDNVYIYYCVNALPLVQLDGDGIYRVLISDLINPAVDPVPQKLASVKASWLNCVDGVLYFSNQSDGGKLYSLHANGGTPNLVYDYKVSEMISDDSNLYFTRSELFGAAIFGINVSGGVRYQLTDESARVVKITTSNGKYLTKVGDYIYFINTDFLTSTVFGDGVYRAKADGSTFVGDVASLITSSAKVIAFEDDKVFSLSSDGECLYYYRTSTRHLYKYVIGTSVETDLMEGYEPPSYQDFILTVHSKSAHYDGSIYFINMLDGGRLYRYDIEKGAEYRVTGSEVADFVIHDRYLYYTVSKTLTNLDLYRIDMHSGVIQLLSEDNCLNYIFIDGKMYYTNDTDKTLEALDPKTLQVEVIFSEKSVKPYRMQYYNEKLYFVADKYLYVYDFETGLASVVNKKLEPLEFIIHNDLIVMMNQEGYLSDYACVYDMKTDTVIKLADLGLSNFSSDVRGTFVYKDEIYFYRNIAAETDTLYGLYKLVKNGDKYEQQLVNKLEGYFICEPSVVGDTLYFIDVWRIKDSLPNASSDAHLYALDLTTLSDENPKITKLN